MDKFLKRYRTRLKLAATQQLEATITKVFNIIADDTALKNNIIMIQARYQNLEQEIISGIIAEPDRVLRTNQIMNSLFQLIDNIQITDLQSSDDVLLNGYLNKNNQEEQQVAADDRTIKTEAAVIKRDLTEVDRSSTDDSEMVDSGSSLAAVNDKKDIPTKSAKDLEIFSEMNRNPLSFFPVIYREVRALVVRNGAANQEMGQLIQDLEKVLPALQHYKNKIDKLEPILKKVRVDYDKKIYWMQFQQLGNRRTGLTTKHLLEIEKMNMDLDGFIKTLNEKGII